jgi:hypothetical protein
MIFQRPAILRVAVLLITLLAFARLTTCSFTWWDDQETIHQNPKLNPPTLETLRYYWTTAGEKETMGLYVPVTYSVWAGLARIAHLQHPDGQGIMLNAAVFHSANVLIHAITAVVVFELLLSLFSNGAAAFFGALLFSLHPVQVETVAWISGTKDLLCGLFSAASLLMFVRSIQLQQAGATRLSFRSRYWFAVLLFVLAMLSKPTAVVVPMMALVIVVMVRKRPIAKTIFALSPWFVLMIPCLIWTQRVQPPPPADLFYVQPALRAVVAVDALAFYFCKLLWPLRLCIDYGHTPSRIIQNHSIYFTWMIPLAVIILLLPGRRKNRIAIAAMLLFLLPLVPTLGLVPFEFQVISTTADHYLYLPMLGIAMLVCCLMLRFKNASWLVAIVLIGLMVRDVFQEQTWQNSRTLFNHVLSINPASSAAMGGLGFLDGRDARRLVDAGQSTAAAPLFEQSISWYRRSLSLSPDPGPALLNLALNYQAIGRQDRWIDQTRQLQMLPPDPIALARRLVESGALAWLDELLRRDPNNLLAIQAKAKVLQHTPRK